MTDVPSRGLPAWIKWLIALAVCALLGLICLEILNRAATARWQRYAVKLRESGLPLTLEEVENARSTVPPEKNGALIIEELAATLKAVSVSGRDLKYRKSGLWPDGCAGVFTCIPSEKIDEWKSMLQAHANVLDELDRLSETPTGRFDIGHGGVANPLTILLPELWPIGQAEHLLSLRVIVNLANGQIDESVHDLQLLEHLAGTLDEHGSMLGRGVQIRIERGVAGLIEGMLGVVSLNAERLDHLEAAIDRRLAAATLKWMLLGERGRYIRFCESWANGTLLVGRSDVFSLAARWTPVFETRRFQMGSAEMFTWLVEAADDFSTLQIALTRFADRVNNARGSFNFMKLLLPNHEGMITLHFSTVALLRTAKAAIACERFRLRSGEFPSRLQNLVPDFLDEVPTDPFSSKPMLMTETEQGIVIYSVGENEKDDDGQVARPKKRAPPPDIGFRLLHPEHRGLLLIDGPEEEDTP